MFFFNLGDPYLKSVSLYQDLKVVLATIFFQSLDSQIWNHRILL